MLQSIYPKIRVIPNVIFDESARLSGPQEPPSDQSTSRPISKMDKGKAKMSKYEDDRFDDNETTHSLDSKFGGFDVPIGVKKALTSANEKLRRSTREKNPVVERERGREREREIIERELFY